MRDMSKQAFMEALTPNDLKGMQVLIGAMPVGIVLFLLVVLFRTLIAPIDTPDAASDGSTVTMLSLVHLILFGAAIVLAPILHRAQLRKVVDGGARGEELAVEAVGAVRQAAIVRLAVLEAPALFGLIICLLASKHELLSVQPIYWLNALSSLIFILFAAMNFPTRERVEAIFDAHFTR